jgi:hypothetical protein
LHYYFILSVGPRVHFRGQKLTFWQKQNPPKNRRPTLWSSLYIEEFLFSSFLDVHCVHILKNLVSSFYPRELAKLRGYTSCFVVACLLGLLVLCSMKQFKNLPLHQGRIINCMCACTCSLLSCHWSRATAAVCLQFGILPLHCSRATAAVCMQLGIRPLQVTAEHLYAV